MLPVNSIGSPYFARLLLSLAKPGTRGSQSFQVLPHYSQWPVWPSSYIGIGEQLYFGTKHVDQGSKVPRNDEFTYS